MQSLVFENKVKLSLILVYYSTEFPLAWEPTCQKRWKRFYSFAFSSSLPLEANVNVTRVLTREGVNVNTIQALTREGADVNAIQDLT